MRFEAKIGNHGEIVIPPDLLDTLHLEPQNLVEVELSPAENKLTGEPIDWDEVSRIKDELREPMIARMRAQGYQSVDELITDLRCR